MILNITAPTTIDKIKWNMFLTNEYGKPSMEWLDNFIDNFSGSLINGNFIITENHKEAFDKLWSAIEEDLNERNLTNLAHNNYGWYFYRQLSTDCNNKIKSKEELKDYIDRYYEELHQHLLKEENSNKEEKQSGLIKTTVVNTEVVDTRTKETKSNKEIINNKLYFENTPELIKYEEDGTEYIECNLICKDIKYNIILYRNGKCKVLAGAFLQDLKYSANESITKNRNKHYNNIIGKTLINDIIFNTPSAAASFCVGHDMNGYTMIKNNKMQSIDIYRTQIKTEIKRYNLKKSTKRRKDIELICKNKDGVIVEHLLLDKNSGEILIFKSSIEELEGEERKSFEDYILDYFKIKCNNVNSIVMENYNHIMKNVKNGEIWEAKIEEILMPLAYIYDYTEE